ncbi:MAG TPA: A/G-specific adenine glycosylase [Anaerolineae bacterium]|nr:A/G-specific adenine glycosylase [Anaerolineae bacterium]
MLTPLAKHLLPWYQNNARALPWRDDPAPYKVWISEIMLQQTRVETVIPYFTRWISALPTIADLAAANLQTVLSLWEGLGYYSRARNLHKAAQIIIQDHGGMLPETIQSLRGLPGIGRYTAAAIASIAFNQDFAALDGNIRRVLTRVYNIREPIGTTQTEKDLWRLAEENLPPGRASEYNQGLMDLGAMICSRRNPHCALCPLKTICKAFALHTQDELPIRPIRMKTPHYTVTAGILQKDDHILIAQRPMKGLLGGLWEFPGGKIEPNEDLTACLRRELLEELDVQVEVGDEYGKYKHAYTHFRITLYAYKCRLTRGEPIAKEHSQVRWVSIGELPDFPMGKIDRQIAKKLISTTMRET